MPTSQIVIKASDISDGFQKSNFGETLSSMKEFIQLKIYNILDLCDQLRTLIISIVGDFDVRKRHTINDFL